MSHSDQSSSAELWGDLSQEQLEGFACVECGLRDGAMQPYGRGPLGQLFAHVWCARARDEYLEYVIDDKRTLEDEER